MYAFNMPTQQLSSLVSAIYPAIGLDILWNHYTYTTYSACCSQTPNHFIYHVHLYVLPFRGYPFPLVIIVLQRDEIILCYPMRVREGFGSSITIATIQHEPQQRQQHKGETPAAQGSNGDGSKQNRMCFSCWALLTWLTMTRWNSKRLPKWPFVNQNDCRGWSPWVSEPFS